MKYERGSTRYRREVYTITRRPWSNFSVKEQFNRILWYVFIQKWTFAFFKKTSASNLKLKHLAETDAAFIKWSCASISDQCPIHATSIRSDSVSIFDKFVVDSVFIKWTLASICDRCNACRIRFIDVRVHFRSIRDGLCAPCFEHSCRLYINGKLMPRSFWNVRLTVMGEILGCKMWAKKGACGTPPHSNFFFLPSQWLSHICFFFYCSFVYGHLNHPWR